jgi:hypothetical protein
MPVIEEGTSVHLFVKKERGPDFSATTIISSLNELSGCWTTLILTKLRRRKAILTCGKVLKDAVFTIVFLPV